jgi:hypothetical protein
MYVRLSYDFNMLNLGSIIDRWSSSQKLWQKILCFKLHTRYEFWAKSLNFLEIARKPSMADIRLKSKSYMKKPARKNRRQIEKLCNEDTEKAAERHSM